MGIGIVGTGKYIPSIRWENSKVERAASLPAGAIIQKTGITQRFIASEQETASMMAVTAGKAALLNAGREPSDVGLIICATFTGDYRYPALACKVQKELGAKSAACFDIMANCAGFQVALSTAEEKLTISPDYGPALVIGVAKQSPFIDWSEPSSAMYFGDGAGAALLDTVAEGYGFLSNDLFSETEAYESVRLRGGGSSYPFRKSNLSSSENYYEMNGLDVWKQFIKYQPISIKRVLAKARLPLEDVDLFLFHQANKNMIDFFTKKLKLDPDKVLTNVEYYGNTAEASLAILLAEANEQNRLLRGSTVVISGVGAGFIFGSSVIRWY